MTWFQKPPLGTPLGWGNPLNKDLVMHLAMNEGHGDVVRDLSMNGNHGTLDGFAFPPNVDSGWNPGQNGIGLNFDKTNDRVKCDNSPTFDITNAMTISSIVYPKTSPAIFSTIMSRRDAAGYDWHLRVSSIGEVSFLPAAGGTFAAGTLDLDKWSVLVVTFSTGTVEIFIDGVSQGSASGKTITATKNVCIGNTDNISADRTWYGSLDQSRLMNRALTAKEVKDYAMNPWQVYLDE